MADLTADALISVETLEEYLSLDGDVWGAEDHDFAVGLINAASQRANTLTARKLKSREYADVRLDGTGSDILLLPEYPVTAVSEVRIDSSRELGDDTILESDEYEYYEDGRLYVPAGIPRSRRCVMITYTAGYVTVPPDLEHAVIESIAYLWKRLRSRAIGTRSVTADGVTTQFEIDIPIPAMRVFQSYGRTR